MISAGAARTQQWAALSADATDPPSLPNASAGKDPAPLGTEPFNAASIGAYRQADSDSVPVLSVDDFVPSGATTYLPLRPLIYRFVFFVFLILLAGIVVVELLRAAVGA
jgi:hypothetical protein